MKPPTSNLLIEIVKLDSNLALTFLRMLFTYQLEECASMLTVEILAHPVGLNKIEILHAIHKYAPEQIQALINQPFQTVKGMNMEERDVIEETCKQHTQQL